MEFVPGRELSRRFYAEAVRPLLPTGLRHSAALIGAGSDVLGYDTPMSMDHDWGPRLTVFVEDVDQASPLSRMLSERLPRTFLGFPTSFSKNDDGTSRLDDGEGRIVHRVEITTLGQFFIEHLGFDPRTNLTPAHWLAVSEQRLLEITAGAVFRDDLGLVDLQAKLAYHPRDVWLYQLASAWERIGQEEHLVGRAGFVGDELGARIIAGRLVRDLMRLTFLQLRTYVPYPKWFGTAFRRLPAAEAMEPLLLAVLRAEGWEERDARLADAYRVVARNQNELGLTEPTSTEPAPFFGRPFRVIALPTGFASKLRKLIEDPAVLAIAARPNIGGIDLFCDSTDLTSTSTWFSPVKALYESGSLPA